MKKNIIMKRILFLLVAFTALITSAQSLVEVRGVETKKSCKYIKRDKFIEGYRTFYYLGFTFINQNAFPVSIEADYYNNGAIEDTKSFELAPKESYFWKVDDAWIKEFVDDGNPTPRGFVKFKAYKSSARIDSPTASATSKSTATPKIEETQQAAIKPQQQLTFTEKMAEFPGGDSAFDNYLTSVIKSLNPTNVGSKMKIQFTVSRTGRMSKLKILSGSLGSTSADESLVQILQSSSSPNWIPGNQNGYSAPCVMVKQITIQ